MHCEIDGAKVKRQARISVCVSNTAANELVAKKDFIVNNFPKAEIGAYTVIYTDRQSLFEEKGSTLKFGKLRIEKMR